ncbi:small-conductance mechanosensitive channel [Sinorhizobium medicae]|uniref:mechanosensitive ion channel family protein n=1 Tax=Sinorhizobium medicae TaxID=110321 RepID=UPI0011AC31FF|nr:mechanosensitive ion channel family protein [Sinorhizobium medicae]TWA25934.1 small-conductance mechanosensitive channel [Sinorhizobium medicae]
MIKNISFGFFPAAATAHFWTSPFALVILLVLQRASWAQSTGPGDPPPEKVRQFLELARNPEVKAWLGEKLAAPAAAPSSSIAEAISSWEAAVDGRIAALAKAFPRVPAELANAFAVSVRDVNSGTPGLVVGILALLLGVGFGTEWLTRRALTRARTPGERGDAGQTVLSDAVALLTFALASVGSFLAFEWPPLLRKVVLTLLLAFIAFRFVYTIARLLVAFGGAGSGSSYQPVPVAETDAAGRFWLRRVSLSAGFLLIGWAVVSLMPSFGFSIDVARLASLAFGFGILAIAIETVWRRPGKITSPVVRSLLSLYLIVLWLAWVAGLFGLLFIGIYSLVLPALTRGVGRVAQVFANRVQLTGALGVMLNSMIVRSARALVIAAAVAWLAYVWRFSAAALAGSEIGIIVINGVLNTIVVLLVADLLWQSSKALIAYRMDLAEHAGGTEDQVARSGRLRTLLPIFRNTLAVFICAVAVLAILSGLGVQIAPLIAGAGIFGVAIGFGSQTLVKDVLSGVFYMLDDAFRIGEYIQSGSYKGTVESFSLRSVRLRHHRGPIFTVPFGELGAVQNLSRDWVIDKMTLNVTYDTDVELARKLIKKVGQELAADPEFAADTLQPLKMQGVDSFGDFAIVLRLKLMTKPGTQFAIKRRAFMMIKKAFDENGVKIAVPTVHVEGSGEPATAAHQLEQVVKKAPMTESAETCQPYKAPQALKGPKHIETIDEAQ